jgi:hypothetical protein
MNIKRKNPKPIKNRVVDVHNPFLYGTLLTEGPQVSEIDWDDGMRSYCPNGWFKRIVVEGKT